MCLYADGGRGYRGYRSERYEEDGPVVTRVRSDAGVRASDAERDAAATELRRHAGAGRLSVDELEQRLEHALGARTRGELEAVMTDLPRERRRSAVMPRRRRPMHLRAYVVVNLALIAVWALSGFGPFWPGWVLLWWGVGIALHARRGPRRWRHEPL